MEALALVSLATTSMTPSLLAHYASQALWLATPIPSVTRRRMHALKWSLPLAALALLSIMVNPYKWDRY